MNRTGLSRLKTWFEAYTASFSCPAQEDQENIRLKQEHTRRVCDNSILIAREEQYDEGSANLAEAVALLPAIGRFPQYRQWRTYNDRDSANHALLGIRVLREQGILEGIPLRERRIILGAVALHNVCTLPPLLDADILTQLRMVRDADRLDIWLVAAELYRKPRDQWPAALGLGLANIPEHSPEVLALLMRGSLVPSSLVKTVTDYKLLQLAWLFDLSFPASYRIAVEQGHYEAIAATLPRSEGVEQALAVVRAEVRKRMAGEGTTGTNG